MPEATNNTVAGSGTAGGLGVQGDSFFFFDPLLANINSAALGFGLGFVIGSQTPGIGGEKKSIAAPQ